MPFHLRNRRIPEPAGLPPGHSAVWIPALENEATNLLAWSEDLSNALWGSQYSGSKGDNNAYVAPDGTTTGDVITFAADARSGVYQAVSMLALQSYTLSVWARTVSGAGSFRLRFYANTTVTYSGNISINETWTRCSFSITTTGDIGTGTSIAIVNDTGASIHSIVVWGAQLNPGPTPLPYRATTTRQSVSEYFGRALPLQLGSTSGADVNDPVWDQRGLVFDGVNDYVTGSASFGSGMSAIVALNTAASTGTILGSSAASPLTFRVNDSKLSLYQTNVGNIGAGSAGITGSYKSVAFSYSGSEYVLYANGAIDASGSQSRIISASAALVGATSSTPAAFFTGSIQGIILYPRIVSPAEVLRAHRWLKAKLATGPGAIALP